MVTEEQLIKTVRDYCLARKNSLPPWANCIGVRYDNKTVTVGEELDASKINPDRDNSREFPEFGSDDYDNLQQLDGTCCYEACFEHETEDKIKRTPFKRYLYGQEDSAYDHCSIVIGKQTNDIGEDDGEVILDRCTIVKVIW